MPDLGPLFTKQVWVELAQALRDWARSAPARHGADLEKKVVDHALGSRSKDQRGYGVELLHLLLHARYHSSPEPPATDLPPDEKPGDSAAHT